MECCLLCLEINKQYLDTIKADSAKWQQLNIEKLIAKHLWNMEYIGTTSWLCYSCWQELYNFHKFYSRVEEAHIDFGKLMKTKIEIQDYKKEDNEKEYLHSDYDEERQPLNKDDLNELFLEPEILLLDQLVKDDENPLVKVEESVDVEKPIAKNVGQKCDSNLLNSKMETISKDPFKNIKPSKSLKPKKKKIKEESCNMSIEESSDNFEKNVSSAIKSNPDYLHISHESENSHNSSNSDDSFTDSDYEPIMEITRSTNKSKKPSKQRIRNRSKVHAKDIFLSEHFKMICVICQIPMDTFKTLLKHFLTEHKERGYAICCSKKFYKRASLLEHVNVHVNPNYFKCNKCDKVLSSRKVLKIHQALHLSEEEKKFACNECGKSFSEQFLLSNHIRSVHQKKYVKICDICGKTLRCTEIFERHMAEHEGKPIPPVSCEICGLFVAHKSALKRHMDIQHPVGGNQPQTCHICHKVSPNIEALKKHLRCTHRDNIYKCAVCERGFKRAVTLRDHMGTHTGAALYTCPWCPKTFNSNGCMHSHRKKHHPKEWEEAQRKRYSEKYKVPDVTHLIKDVIS